MLHSAIIRFLFGKIAGCEVSGVENKNINSLHWSFCTTSHSLTSTPWSKWVVCMTCQEQRPYLFGNLCKANTASYHPSSTGVMRTQSLYKVKDCYVMCEQLALWYGFAQIILMPHLFLQHWNLANKADPCVETLAREQNDLVYLEHLCVTLHWKLFFLSLTSSLTAVLQPSRIIAFQWGLKLQWDRAAWNMWDCTCAVRSDSQLSNHRKERKHLEQENRKHSVEMVDMLTGN